MKLINVPWLGFNEKTGMKLSVKTPYVQQVSARDVSMAPGSGRS
jgi:hypothetical protein